MHMAYARASGMDLTGISVRSQVRILYVMKKKNGINEI